MGHDLAVTFSTDERDIISMTRDSGEATAQYGELPALSENLRVAFARG